MALNFNNKIMYLLIHNKNDGFIIKYMTSIKRAANPMLIIIHLGSTIVYSQNKIQNIEMI